MKNDIKVIEKDTETHYCNTVRINSSQEEVFLDFGVNRPSESGLVVELNDRVAMNYFTAKRLVLNLGQHLRAFEEKHGKVDLSTKE